MWPSWARLIAEVYQVDPLVCVRCGQRMRLIAFPFSQLRFSMTAGHTGV